VTAFRKITIGLVTLLPLPLMLLALVLGVYGMESFPDRPAMAFLPHAAYYTTCILIAVFLISDMFTNPAMRPDKRLLWIVVLILGNIIAFPVYWYLYIWRDRPADEPPTSRTFCRWCGYEYEYPLEECVNCGRSMAGGTFVCTLNYERVGSFLPYRNRPALWGYYAGVFSMVPGPGIILGPVAVILGMKGLALHRDGPDRKGRAHAITAIALGIPGTLLSVATGVAVYRYLL